MDNTVKAQLIQTTGGIVGDLMRMWFSRPAMRVAQVETPQAVVNQLSEPVKQTYVPPTPPVSQPERKLTTNELSGDANKEEDYRFECLPAWTTLYGKERVAEITDFGSANYGNEYGVYTHTGKHQTVNGYMSRDYAGKMMNLQFWYTNIPLVITPNHPILGVQNVRTPQNDLWRWNGGIDEDRLDWFETGNATNRDFIAFPRITETIDMDIISPQLSELFGWYVAEGNVDKTSGTITISLGNHETERISRVTELITNLMGRQPGIDTAVATRISFSCEPLAVVLKQFGIGATHKKIPSWFLTLPDYKQYPFLYAMINGDGSTSKYSMQYSTSSETLAYHLRLLLFRLGILHGVRCLPIVNGNIDGREVVMNTNPYCIRVSGDALRYLMASVNMECDPGKHTSGNFGWVSKNYVFIPVKSVTEETFYGKVYNIGVENDESYLTIHGSLHNCLLKHFGGASVLLREAYERANDSGTGDGSAEKFVEAMNEHAGAEADLDAMKGMPEIQGEVDKLLSGVRQFRAAAWKAGLPVGGGTKDDIEAARTWNGLMMQTVYENAKKHTGHTCVQTGM